MEISGFHSFASASELQHCFKWWWAAVSWMQPIPLPLPAHSSSTLQTLSPSNCKYYDKAICLGAVQWKCVEHCHPITSWPLITFHWFILHQHVKIQCESLVNSNVFNVSDNVTMLTGKYPFGICLLNFRVNIVTFSRHNFVFKKLIKYIRLRVQWQKKRKEQCWNSRFPGVAAKTYPR